MKKLITICKYDLKFNYYVTDDGKIWSERSQKFLTPQLDKNGYEKVQMISKDNKRHFIKNITEFLNVAFIN